MKLLSKKSTTTYRYGSKYDVAMGDAIGQSFDFYEVDFCDGIMSDIRILHVIPGPGLGSTATVKESRLTFEIAYPESRFERDVDRIIFEAENATRTKDADRVAFLSRYGHYPQGIISAWKVCLPSDVWFDDNMPSSLYDYGSIKLTPEEARQHMVEVYENDIFTQSLGAATAPVSAHITVFQAGFTPSSMGRYHWYILCPSTMTSFEGYESSFRDARDACIAAAHTSAILRVTLVLP